MNKMILVSYEDEFNINQMHVLDDDSILKSARDALESAGARFSMDAIMDANVRVRYMNGIKRMSLAVQEEVASGRVSIRDAAIFCNEVRNQILEEGRKVTSTQARAYAEYLKPTGVSLDELLDKYSKPFKKSFSELTEFEKNQVYYSVIEASGRDRATVTIATKRLKLIGKVGLLVTAVLATHAILNSENKVTEIARQGTVIQGGVLGMFVAGLTVGAICGPGAPACAVAVLLIGAATGSVATEVAFETYMDEVKEYATWGIR
jgi:hypothetical protein